MLGLARFRNLILGLQSLRGKILSRKDLAFDPGISWPRSQYEMFRNLSQGWMNRERLWKSTQRGKIGLATDLVAIN
jgi:hypothetical protein